MKKVLSVSALSAGTSSGNGLQVAKKVGTKAVKAATVIGIKTLLLNLVFGVSTVFIITIINDMPSRLIKQVINIKIFNR